jgi:TetR/AcrR family transcriptional regulator
MNGTLAKRGRGRSGAPAGKRKRDSALTREMILRAATIEFCQKGLEGARVEAIANRAKANMRMLYQHFGDKHGLYLAVLDRVYTDIRAAERQLNLDNLDPIPAMRALVDFTFTLFQNHKEYVSLINNENLQRGRYLRKSPKITAMTAPLVTSIENILHRGKAANVFRSGVNPIQLYVSITALSYFHVSNRYTLSAMFDRNLDNPEWLAQRRAHAQEVILTWLTMTETKRANELIGTSIASSTNAVA